MAFTDTFTGTNGNPPDANYWATPTGATAPNIYSNQLQGTAAYSASYVIGAIVNDQYAQATMNLVTIGAGSMGPCVRHATGALTCYYAQAYAFNDGTDHWTVDLVRYDAGTPTVLDTYTDTSDYLTDETLKLEVSGYDLTVSIVGGSTLITHTDTNANKIASGQPAILFLQNNADVLADDFESTERIHSGFYFRHYVLDREGRN